MSIGKVFIGNDNHGASWRAYQIDGDPVTVALICASPAALDATTAGKLATFLLAAAGPDAARKALAKLAPGYEIGECDACEKTTLLTPTGKAGAVSICAPCLETSYQEHTASMAEQMAALAARASLAEKRLAAVLALTFEDVRALSTWQEIQALIRSRATEGAEAPTGAAT